MSETPTPDGGIVSKASLFERRITSEAVTVPGLGVFIVQALSREDSLKVADAGSGPKGSVAKADREMLRWGIVEPELTYQEVEKMCKAQPTGAIEILTDAIGRLSEMDKGDTPPDKVTKEAVLPS